MEYRKRVYCDRDHVDNREIFIVEMRGADGEKHLIPNGCEEMSGGDICAQCCANAAKNFISALTGDGTRDPA